jgi:hypothetical protein
MDYSADELMYDSPEGALRNLPIAEGFKIGITLLIHSFCAQMENDDDAPPPGDVVLVVRVDENGFHGAVMKSQRFKEAPSTTMGVHHEDMVRELAEYDLAGDVDKLPVAVFMPTFAAFFLLSMSGMLLEEEAEADDDEYEAPSPLGGEGLDALPLDICRKAAINEVMLQLQAAYLKLPAPPPLSQVYAVIAMQEDRALASIVERTLPGLPQLIPSALLTDAVAGKFDKHRRVDQILTFIVYHEAGVGAFVYDFTSSTIPTNSHGSTSVC